MKLTEEQKEMNIKRKEENKKTALNALDMCLPCPFCGDYPIVEVRKGGLKPEYRIGCNCLCKDSFRYNSETTFHTSTYRNVLLAVKEWNRRENQPVEECDQHLITVKAQNDQSLASGV